MVNNSKHIRIFKMLQDAGDDGVSEAKLFNDLESSNNTSTIKFRVNKYIENLSVRSFIQDKIIVEDGIWKLDKYFVSLKRGDIEVLLRDFRIEQVSIRFSLTIISVVAMFLIMMTVTASVFYNLGNPETVEECLEVFGVDLIEE